MRARTAPGTQVDAPYHDCMVIWAHLPHVRTHLPSTTYGLPPWSYTWDRLHASIYSQRSKDGWRTGDSHTRVSASAAALSLRIQTEGNFYGERKSFICWPRGTPHAVAAEDFSLLSLVSAGIWAWTRKPVWGRSLVVERQRGDSQINPPMLFIALASVSNATWSPDGSTEFALTWCAALKETSDAFSEFEHISIHRLLAWVVQAHLHGCCH